MLLDKQTNAKNYFEASASCMLIYAFAKGVRKGYLPAHILPMQKKDMQGSLKNLSKPKMANQSAWNVRFPGLVAILIVMEVLNIT